MLSGAPFVSTWTPAGPLASTLTIRRSKSNGSSARFWYAAMAGCSCARMAASSGLRTPLSNALLMLAHRSTSSDDLPRASTADCIFNAPSVSVPVLSLHSTSMVPRFSIADRCLTITLPWAMRSAPAASVTVIIIGRNSGVRPTASASANSRD